MKKRILSFLLAAALCIGLIPVALPAAAGVEEHGASLEITLTEGQGVSVFCTNMLVAGANTVTVTPSTIARYDIAYADDSSGEVKERPYMNYSHSLTLEDTRAYIVKENDRNAGLLLRIYVRQGSVDLCVTNDSPKAKLVTKELNESPVMLPDDEYRQVSNDLGPVPFITPQDKAIPVILGGTSGTVLRHTVNKSQNNYYTYNFTGSNLMRYTFINGQRIHSEHINYDSTITVSSKLYYLAFVELPPKEDPLWD